MTPHILPRMKSQVKLNEPRDIVFWAACLVAFYGLLRKSNLLPTSGSSYSKLEHLSKNSLCITPLEYSLTVLWSKTIQYRERDFKVFLPLVTDHPLCPVTAVTNLLQLNINDGPTDPLFSFPTPRGYHIYTQREFEARLHAFFSLPPSL